MARIRRITSMTALSCVLAAGVAAAGEPSAAAPGASATTERAAFDERELTVGSGEWAVPGTLSMPTGQGPFAAVVLVHGSGPHDRDETIGPNKPFREIAHGLVARGVAVLRYDKRSKVHGAKLATFGALTAKEEAIDDAVLAVERLRTTERIDPARVFVLGHSLGGTLAPRIAKAAPEVAGLVILAGTSRPLPEVIIEQLDYLAGRKSGAERAQILAMKQQAAQIAAATTDTPGLLFGAPASYWLDLAAHDAAEEAGSLPQRFLVLQGERDYQVTMSDFEGWKRGLAAHPHAEFRSYPRLNHLFMDGEGKATPEEYLRPGHVDTMVIADIVAFVLDHKGTHKN